MKKFLLMSLIATFIVVFSASAQNNTYNMVIKMANGVTITIGPNEIENIAFKDGEVFVSGKQFDDFIKEIEEIKAIKVDKNDFVEEIHNLKNIINNLQSGTYDDSEIRNQITDLQKQLSTLSDDIGEDVNNLQDQINWKASLSELTSLQAYMSAEIIQLNAKIVALKADIDAIMNMIDK